MKKISLAFGLCLVAFYACNNAPKTDPAAATATTPSTTATTTTPPPASEPAAAAAKIVNIEGQLTEVEDGGYPMATLSIVPTGQPSQVTINFNQEIAPAFKIEDLNKMLNKNVVASYEEKTEMVAVDIQVGGKTIVGTEGAPMPDWQKMSGTLTATEATKGDMPGTFSLKTADGKNMSFEYFITPEMVAQNGKTVDVFAMQMPRMSLKSISAK
jgi:hypothetical protein